MIKFKPLEIKPKQSWLKRLIQSPYTKRTILFAALGGIAGFLFFYFTQGQHLTEIPARDIIKSILIGSLFGIIITNSPCARNKC